MSLSPDITNSTSFTADLGVVTLKASSKRWSAYGWKGCLRDMPNLPLDLLYDIFQHLNPIDMLQLSRSSRDFRGLLMDRKSAFLWQAARQNIEGLPDCPTFLSEPEYANLVFDTTCFICRKPNVKGVMWEFRARYCVGCSDQMTAPWIVAAKRFPDGLPPNRVLFTPQNPIYYSTIQRRVHLRDVEKFIQEWGATDVEKREEYLKRQEDLIKDIRQFASACNSWQSTRKQAKEEKVERIRAERLTQHLRELGWGDEVDLMAENDYRPLSQNRFVRLTTAWNDKSWVKAKPHVIQAMESIKRDRLRSYHQQVMLGRLRILDLATLSYRRHPELRGKLFPHTRVIASFPEIRQIIDKPDDISVTIDDFLALTQTVHKSVADWRDKRISFFADCVRRQFDIPENIDPLQLAIGQFFQCNRCQRALALPYALGHYCYRTLKDHLDDYDLFADSAYCANLTLAVEARVDAINSLLEACNRDTRTTTVQDMDDLDLRFTCRLCNDFLVLFKELMDWHEAALHATEMGGHGAASAWKVVKSADVPGIEDVERTARNIANPAGLHIWECGHCTSMSCYPQEQILHHVQTAHNIENPVLHQDFFRVVNYNKEICQVYIAKADEELPDYLQQVVNDGVVVYVDDPDFFR
ncbi:hypothetical protein NLI96_g1862 [Meripilus lineatus]|uniref:F-box domain-containing protein n=1 Tax=Meripilus lineatus TaxID=2056292 RepID=A0AAD5VE32_9APHY|nr:hypothetical protein NLI96_g1862 [Physisporinus lineatus]